MKLKDMVALEMEAEEAAAESASKEEIEVLHEDLMSEFKSGVDWTIEYLKKKGLLK